MSRPEPLSYDDQRCPSCGTVSHKLARALAQRDEEIARQAKLIEEMVRGLGICRSILRGVHGAESDVVEIDSILAATKGEGGGS